MSNTYNCPTCGRDAKCDDVTCEWCNSLNHERIRELERDSALLEYMIRATDVYVVGIEMLSTDEYSLLLLEDVGHGNYYRDTYFDGNTPREAIDNAMKGGE